MAPLILLKPIHAKIESRTIPIEPHVVHVINFFALGDFTGESLQEQPERDSVSPLWPR